MGEEQRSVAKRQMIALMDAGHCWQDAVAAAGIHWSRSSAYRLRQEVQMKGDAAFSDGRHGHPSKLSKAVLQWLLATCRADSQMPSREVQAALQEQFGTHVSIGHLNCVRTQLGIGNHVGRSKKNSKQYVPQRKLSVKREPEGSFLSPPLKKRVCYPH